MSKQQTKRTIRAEIARLNSEIDLRIIKGLSYRREAQRHKFLMSQLSRISESRLNFNWFTRSFGFIGTFMF